MKKGLGRGLNSLFGEYEEENSTEKVVETKIEQVIVNEPKEINTIHLLNRCTDRCS